MEIYVEELPKNCDSCDIYKSYLGCCLTDFSRATSKAVRHNKCPLKSLAEHDKQVRNEVIEEIRYSLLDFSHGYWKVFKQNGRQYMTDDDLMECLGEILDKIGEKNVKN